MFKNGAVIDTRPESEKQKQFTQREVVASTAPVQWVEKTLEQCRKFPIFDQDGSGSCVMQTECKELGIMRWLKDKTYVHFSATDGYQRRINKPDAGMAYYDARRIAREGITLEVLAPSQGMTDAQMDSAVVEQYKRDVGAVFSVPNSLDLPIKDIDAVASTIQQTGKGVMVWFYFTSDEWTNRPKILNVNLPLNGVATLRHSVCAVDFALINGKKCLIIDDSWGPGAASGGQRIIDEDFYKVRNWYAGYLVNFKFDEGTEPKPVHTFNVDMHFGETNEEVRWLQKCLKYEKLFPSNADATGYYGAITAESVKKFQAKYGIDASSSPLGRDVGPKTRAKLNSLFG
jgi:hypothetical protein